MRSALNCHELSLAPFPTPAACIAAVWGLTSYALVLPNSPLLCRSSTDMATVDAREVRAVFPDPVPPKPGRLLERDQASSRICPAVGI
ncbi:MAG: hypothetical protein ACPIOQ_37175 [Promethearchaeia archaeon]